MVGRRNGSTDRVVGRNDELARIESLLGDALTGYGRLVVCTGEAGIGKTRLAEELAATEQYFVPRQRLRQREPSRNVFAVVRPVTQGTTRGVAELAKVIDSMTS